MRLVFVSSTFKDMQFERDALSIRLAPRINDFLLRYGESVRFGDLRWGVNTSELESEESSKKVLKVCLDEIDNAKPYMIVFIGERYGWIPSSSLLDQAMVMKDIKDVPDDISVTNLEIEYGALLDPDYEGRVLFYFRNPFDTSKMSEEEKKIYASESPLHKQKLEALKEKILKLYPKYVRYYDVSYDNEKKCLTGLDSLMDTIYQDLTHIFNIDLEYYNQLPAYKRAVMNSEVYFASFYKYAYYRDNLKDEIDVNSELKENYEDGRYEDIPCLRYIIGKPGSGRKTTLACLYKLAKDENEEYVLPFVFGLDKFTNSKQDLIETLISFYEEKLHYKKRKSKNILTLVDLIRYNDEHDKHHFQIFIMNHHKDIILFLKELENTIEKMFHTTFYVMGDEERKDYSPYLAFAFHSNSIYLEELNDEEKLGVITKTCESKRKELSNVVIQRILEKESSSHPLYLSLVVERLLMLDNEDFQNIRNLGDGMEAINQYMLSIVDQLGNDVYSITKELFKELGERINYDTVMRILYLASHNCNLEIDEYRDFFKKNNIPYQELDCSLLYNTIPSLFMPISIYNQIAFSYEAGRDAARELSEAYVEEDFYLKYINYLDDSDFSLAKKLAVFRSRKDVRSFYQAYVLLLEKINTTCDENLLSKPYIGYMDYISDMLDIIDDDFHDEFYKYAIEQLIATMNEQVISVLFYPHIFRLSTIEETSRCVKTIWATTKQVNEAYKTQKNNNNLILLMGLLDSLSASIEVGGYTSYYFDFEDEEEYLKECYQLSKNLDVDTFNKLLDKSSICQVYYTMFNRRSFLTNAVFHYSHKDEYSKYENYYRRFVLDNFKSDELINTILNEDYEAWNSQRLINSLIAFFYYVLINKYTGKKNDYLKSLNYYLKLAELILQNDFFSEIHSSIYESYFIEPLFQSFAKLVNLDDVDGTTRDNLLDWLVIKGREMVTKDTSNNNYLNIYASILNERDDVDLSDQDFFFIYPCLYKSLQKHFDNELWIITMNLLTRTTALYNFEIDLEFVLLAVLRFNNCDKDLEPILMRLHLLLQINNRDVVQDDLIIDLYKNLYLDEGLKNKKQYREYLEKYIELLPNEEN